MTKRRLKKRRKNIGITAKNNRLKYQNLRVLNIISCIPKLDRKIKRRKEVKE